MNTLEVTVDAPEKASEACCRALELETDSDALRRSSVEVSRKENKLTLRMQADDLTALRASMNTFLRWADMCLTLAKE